MGQDGRLPQEAPGEIRVLSGRRAAPARLSGAAIAWRAAHTAIAATFLGAIALVWWSALTGRRGRLLRPAIAALVGEGALVAANGGDCPLGPLQAQVDDPVPLFELVLPPRAARLAVPVLGAVTAAGLALLAARGPTADGTETAAEIA